MPEFKEVNFLHFKDIFFEDYEIALSYTLLSSILKSAGLPVEFAKRGIRTPAQANEFLKEYRFAYNEKFSVSAEGSSLFVQV